MSLKLGPLFYRSPTIVLSLPMVVSPGLFSSNGFALLSGATSYRKVHAFIQAHYKTLDEAFGLNWKKLSAYTTFGDIIQGTSPCGFLLKI